jgi:hypothetical protein
MKICVNTYVLVRSTNLYVLAKAFSPACCPASTVRVVLYVNTTTTYPVLVS